MGPHGRIYLLAHHMLDCIVGGTFGFFAGKFLVFVLDMFSYNFMVYLSLLVLFIFYFVRDLIKKKAKKAKMEKTEKMEKEK